MKKVAETSNNNLVRNARAFLNKGGQIDVDNAFRWVDNSIEDSKKEVSNVVLRLLISVVFCFRNLLLGVYA